MLDDKVLVRPRPEAEARRADALAQRVGEGLVGRLWEVALVVEDGHDAEAAGGLRVDRLQAVLVVDKVDVRPVDALRVVLLLQRVALGVARRAVRTGARCCAVQRSSYKRASQARVAAEATKGRGVSVREP